MNAIKFSELETYMQETLAWRRLLEFYKQENAFLKTRLSQVLDNNTEKSFIETAEYFNNHFIFFDELIASLLQDTRQQKDMLEISGKGDHNNDKLINKYQQKLRKEMEKFEKEAATLKHDFNSRLSSSFQIS